MRLVKWTSTSHLVYLTSGLWANEALVRVIDLFPEFALSLRARGLSLVLFLAISWAAGICISQAAELSARPVRELFTNDTRQFLIAGYHIKGDPGLTNSALVAGLDRFSSTSATVIDIAKAASALQAACQQAGHTNVTISVGMDEITNGIISMYVFHGLIPQLLIDGRRCAFEQVDLAPTVAATQQTPAKAGATNAPASSNAATNNPGFPVRAYEIRGDTLLSTNTLLSILEKYTGTNITVGEIVKAGTDLQLEYHRRGFATVNVTIPPQKLDSNAIVKIQVFEGRLVEINVTGNRYFSSNNVMRAFPSLKTNLILVEPVFQAELDRANANQDRQIYPQIRPGPSPATSAMDLQVKDRLPLHAKVEFNNLSSPGTPELRVNTSATYDNLWQLEHSIGVQYSFSPESYKTGDQWNFYDQPLVANYSAFYRMPLGNPPPLAETIATRPGSFGFSEATRQFRLPPPSGRPELNFFASRSTIDTGIEQLGSQVIYNVPGVREVSRQDVQEDLTVNEDLGFRLSAPLSATEKLRSTLSGGLDYKGYSLLSSKTNVFSFTEITVNANGSTNPPIISSVASPVPITDLSLNYLPLLFHYDGSLKDSFGTTAFGLGFSVNTWYSGSKSNLQSITGSRQSSGNWVTLTPSVSRDILFHTNWVLAFRADGQWASEPLISTERFGAGGVYSVRGYREGEVFGDTGWRVTAEQKTPAHIVGKVYGGTPLIIRGAVFMDYAETYLLDPKKASSRTPLWGTGFGGVMSIGPYWEARLLFSWPLLDAGTTEAYQPRFNFSLSAQF
jgi:hemolysin activation/secretion protein